ncbi:hypothetical protein ACTWQB_03415 [Piscibacillus sp. B03]|uniref:hypothetical protein n=1 Tax=Piscibacillus sp. B03 TaxID=3457430 RepID=UPI003FCD96BC
MKEKTINKRITLQVMIGALLLVGFVIIIQVTTNPDSKGVVEDIDEEPLEEVEEEKELIDNPDDLDIDLDLTEYDEDMSLEELESYLDTYQYKIELLNERQERLEEHFYFKLHSYMMNEQEDLRELVMKKRDAAYEWTVFETEEQLNEYFYEEVPGLKRAEEVGVVDEIKQTFVQEHNNLNDARIDRIWYNTEGFYLFYSFKVGDVPEGRLHSSLHLSHNEYTLRDNWMTREPVYHDGRIYQAIRYLPLDHDESEIDDVNGEFVFDVEIGFDNNRLQLIDQTIPLNEYKEQHAQYEFEIPINKTIDTNELNLTIEKLEHQLGGNTLFIQAENHNLYGVETDINDENVYHFKDKIDGYDVKLPIRATDEFPDPLDITIKKIHYVKDDKLAFNVDTSEVKYQEKLEVDQSIGEISGNEFFIDHLDFTKEGLYVYLRVENDGASSKFNTPVNVSLPYFGGQISDFNHFTIKDLEGEEVNYRHLKTSVDRDRNLFGVTVPGNGDTFTIELSNLLMSTTIDENFSVEIEPS